MLGQNKEIKVKGLGIKKEMSLTAVSIKMLKKKENMLFFDYLKQI